jgi:hypothetical protein
VAACRGHLQFRSTLAPGQAGGATGIRRADVAAASEAIANNRNFIGVVFDLGNGRTRHIRWDVVENAITGRRRLFPASTVLGGKVLESRRAWE